MYIYLFANSVTLIYLLQVEVSLGKVWAWEFEGNNKRFIKVSDVINVFGGIFIWYND